VQHENNDTFLSRITTQSAMTASSLSPVNDP